MSVLRGGAEKNDGDIKAIEMMDVADLRNELQEADLALDGSHSVLVKRLETYRKKRPKIATTNRRKYNQLLTIYGKFVFVS